MNLSVCKLHFKICYLLNNCLNRLKYGLLRLKQLLKILHKAFGFGKFIGAFLYQVGATGKFSSILDKRNLQEKLKYCLYSTKYCGGLLVIFQALPILLVRF